MKTNGRKSVLLIAFLSVFFLSGLNAQTLTVKGKVTDASDGSAIPGVSVFDKGTKNYVATDRNGNYSIQTSKGAVLQFTCVGYIRKDVTVTGEVLNVDLKPLQILEEVVVTKDKETKIEAKEFGKLKVASIDAALQGRTAGLDVTSNQFRGFTWPTGESTEEYNTFLENRFKSVKEEPLSTFSIDVDAASYSNMRRFVNQGQLPPVDAIRTEELVNYFSYNYPQPTSGDPVKITTEVGICPWNERHRLVRIGLKAKEISDNNLPVSNLVFLIDVSGSMQGPTRLDLVKSSLKLLINNLREKDKVAIVVYAGSAGEVLPATSGSNKQKIREALDKLTAGGSTAGGAGIQLAYSIAKKNFVSGGNNRIILCTDGDFNVGVSSQEGLEHLIEKERKASGVFLTVLGYGMGNYKDNRMQVLAEKGNGNHAYIDNLQEANKVLVSEFGGTIYTVAKDVKLQIEFNPAVAQAYRLIGYESRLLNKEDFNDDTKDAGEMGAGHCVTAFYEVIPFGVESNFGNVDELRYQPSEKRVKTLPNASKELLTVKLRYKQPDGNTSKKMDQPLTDDGRHNVSSDFRFAAAVAMFGQLLRNSDFKADATYEKVISLAKTALDNDDQGYRREFVRLAETVRGMEK